MLKLCLKCPKHQLNFSSAFLNLGFIVSLLFYLMTITTDPEFYPIGKTIRILQNYFKDNVEKCFKKNSYFGAIGFIVIVTVPMKMPFDNYF